MEREQAMAMPRDATADVWLREGASACWPTATLAGVGCLGLGLGLPVLLTTALAAMLAARNLHIMRTHLSIPAFPCPVCSGGSRAGDGDGAAAAAAQAVTLAAGDI